MYKSKLLLLSITALFTLGFISPTSAIYGGATASSAPNVVKVIKEYADGNRYGNCSGALMAPRVVVTAAHCVTEAETGLLAKNVWVSPPGARYKDLVENGRNYLVLEGASSVAESRAIYEKYRAVSIQITSSYYSSSDIVEDNDVAFLVLDEPLPVTTNIVIASDEETENFIDDEVVVRLYGYGQTSFQSASSSVPMTTTMNIYTRSINIKNSAYLESVTSTACPGDSGGPVIVSTPSKLYLVGIISGGQTATVGPECSKRVDGAFYTLITLVTKYANLAFAAAVAAEKESESDQKKIADELKQSRDAQVKSETAAKSAQDAQTKAEAEAKLAKDAQVKSDSESKSARDAQTRAEVESQTARDLASRAESAAKSSQEARLASETELAKIKVELAQSNSQIVSLGNSLKDLENQLASLKKKLTSICKAKPKPKGC